MHDEHNDHIAVLERRECMITKKVKQKKGVKSTPHKKGVRRQSGKSYRYKMVLPDDLKPLRTGMYKIWVTVTETEKKKNICFDFHSTKPVSL